jgi:hypothetical protein
MNPIKTNVPSGNTICLPLCKRGIEGDFCNCSEFKSPLAPLSQRGECSFSVVKGFK